MSKAFLLCFSHVTKPGHKSKGNTRETLNSIDFYSDLDMRYIQPEMKPLASVPELLVDVCVLFNGDFNSFES